MTDRERDYLRMWILQDLVLILKNDPEQREALDALMPDLKSALYCWAIPELVKQ